MPTDDQTPVAAPVSRVGIFIDGTGVTPGSEGCQCSNECEFPCWQRLGMAPACEACGCDIDTGYSPPGKQIGPLHFQRNAWGGLWISWKRAGAWRTLTLWKPRWEFDRG